jgi:hypothetical protein
VDSWKFRAEEFSKSLWSEETPLVRQLCSQRVKSRVGESRWTGRREWIHISSNLCNPSVTNKGRKKLWKIVLNNFHQFFTPWSLMESQERTDCD